jgi:hypothetical protein
MAELPILDLRNVGKVYELNDQRIEALRDANLVVEKGRIRLPDRRFGLRQIHLAPHCGGVRASKRW